MIPTINAAFQRSPLAPIRSSRLGHVEVSNELFSRFVRGGFGQLTNTEPVELADFLERHAATTGQSAPLFIAQAIRAVDQLFHDHDERGGIRTGFVDLLDELVRNRLPTIRRSDQYWAAKLASDFRNEVLALVQTYDSRNPYE